MADASGEIAAGDRFGFGVNWQRFLQTLDDTTIATARDSLVAMLEASDLTGSSFLDIGSGSGLFSLAARQLGARVTSFDFDPESVACARQLRNEYGPDDPLWTILQGSVLDDEFLTGLGRFDVVYAWGVLHHTGDMWRAIDNALGRVESGGKIYLAIYNDQGAPSRVWRAVKRRYNASGPIVRWLLLTLVSWRFQVQRMAVGIAKRVLRVEPRPPRLDRGMRESTDLVDWVGGWPFEVATPHAIFDHCSAKGFSLTRMYTCGGGLGCNEFVFRRHAPA